MTETESKREFLGRLEALETLLRRRVSPSDVKVNLGALEGQVFWGVDDDTNCRIMLSAGGDREARPLATFDWAYVRTAVPLLLRLVELLLDEERTRGWNSLTADVDEVIALVADPS